MMNSMIALKWANTTLMENYLNKQRDGTLKQIAKLYDEKDVTLEVLDIWLVVKIIQK